MRKHGTVFCGQRLLPSLITSEGNSLRIEFNSDNSVQKTGFAALFFTGTIYYLLIVFLKYIYCLCTQTEFLIIIIFLL